MWNSQRVSRPKEPPMRFTHSQRFLKSGPDQTRTGRTRRREARRKNHVPLLLEALEYRALLATVAVFDNGAYVDTAGGASAESDTVQASLQQLGHVVSTFTSTTAAGIS